MSRQLWRDHQLVRYRFYSRWYSRPIIRTWNMYNWNRNTIYKTTDILTILLDHCIDNNWWRGLTFAKETSRPSCSSLQWRHNECDGVSNTSLTIVCWTAYSRRRSKKTPTLSITGLCEGNSPVTGEFPAQWACNAGNVSIWWCHYDIMFDVYGNIYRYD